MDHNEHLRTLTEIRSLMERSSRFISLSGLSGVFAGIFAVAGAYVFYHYYATGPFSDAYTVRPKDNPVGMHINTFIILDAVVVIALALGAGVLLTVRNSKKKGISVWDATAKRLVFNLAIPLITGGLFCMVLLFRGYISLVAPATLVFYGLALINASKYTLNDIRYLGMCEIVLGLTGMMFPGYGLILWAMGFGVLHIIYGAVMYYKYER